MDATTVVIVAFVLLLVLILLEMPIGMALIFSGSLGTTMLASFDVAGSQLSSAPLSSTGRFLYVVVPMYLLLGMFALHGGIAEQLYGLANRWFRNWQGGVGAATLVACGFFAAVSGSSIGTAVTMTKLSHREMLKSGYPPGFAAGLVAAGGTLGVLIPPSVILVIVGVITEQSIGRLLLAGIIPGVLSAGIYLIYVIFRSRSILLPVGLRGDIDDYEVDDQEDLAPISGRATYFGLAKAVLIFGLVLAGIYTGVFTVAESGALAALLAFVMMITTRWRQDASSVPEAIRDSLREAAATTSMAFTIVVGAAVYTFFLALSGVPREISSWLVGLDVSPYLILVLVLGAMVLLGMILDPLSILAITMPLVFPAIVEMGFDGIWFAILTVKMIELGLITPPLGINVFVVAGAADRMPVEQVFKGILPFAGLDVLTTAVLFAFPILVLWLPNTFMS